MNSKLLLFIFLLFQIPLHSQYGLIDRIEERLGLSKFEHFELAKVSGKTYPDLKLNEDNADHLILDLNEATIKEVLNRQPDQIRLSLPYFDGKEKELLLIKRDIVTPDFVITEGGTKRILPDSERLRAHYQGVHADNHMLIAAISFFENEVSGLISLGNGGNLNLGKLKTGEEDGNEHILFNDITLNKYFDFHHEHDIIDDGASYTKEELFYDDHDHHHKNANKCVRLYLEADYQLFQALGSLNSTTNYVEGLFNIVSSIYANENITMVMSELLVWTTDDPYPNNSISTALEIFRVSMVNNGFNGDLAHLLFDGQDGGGLAYVPGLCRQSNPVGASNMNGWYSYSSNLSVFSWPVYVLTHELGHNLNAQHTHACVWNGNNTAIDGCGGSTEGSCALPGIPSGGGTIMSYCHLESVGVNLSLGFGTQPGNVMRSWVNNATCIGSCANNPPPASCSVTFTNTGCQTASLYLGNNGTLQFFSDIVGSGGTYTVNTFAGYQWVMQVGGNTVSNYTVECPNTGHSFDAGDCGPATCNVTFTNTGCRTAELYVDHNGNFEFVSNIAGNNTYTAQASDVGDEWFMLVDGDVVGNYTAACPNTGHSFDAGECPATTCNITFTNTGCRTAALYRNDNGSLGFIGTVAGNGGTFTVSSSAEGEEWEMRVGSATVGSYTTVCPNNGYVFDAGDCGSNDCTYSTLFTDDFEGGFGNWIDGGSDCLRTRDANFASSGEYAIEIRDDTNTSHMRTNNLDLSDVDEITVNFTYITRSMEQNERFVLEYSINGGNDYTIVEEYIVNTDFNNGERYFETVLIPGSFSNETIIRFRCDASGNGDEVFLDDITIETCAPDAVTCDVTFTNTGCQAVELYRNNNGSLELVGTIAGGGAFTVNSTEGEQWEMRAGSTTMGSYTTACPNNGYSFDGGECPPATCDVTFTNTGCQTAELYRSNNGNLEFISNITGNGGTFTVNSTEDEQWEMRVGSTTMGSYRTACPNNGYSFDGGECPPVACDVSFTNTGCQTAELYRNNNGNLEFISNITGNGGTFTVNSTEDEQWEMRVGSNTVGSYTTVCPNSGYVFDAGDCNDACVYSVLISDNFENGYGNWIDGGTDCLILTGNSGFANSAPFCVELRDDTGSSHMRTGNLNLSSTDEMTVDFTYIARSMEVGERLVLEYSTNGGSSYTIAEEFVSGTHFANGVRYFETIAISGPFSAQTVVRFRCDASSDFDEVFLDDVTIETCESNVVSCNVTFNNTGCQSADLYRSNGSLEFVATIAGSGTYTTDTYVGENWVMQVGANTVSSYTAECPNNGHAFDAGECPPVNCNVTFSNTGCQSADLYRNNNGSLQFVTTIVDGGAYTANSTAGEVWEMRVSNTTVGNYTTQCPNNGYSFDAGGCDGGSDCTSDITSIVVDNGSAGYSTTGSWVFSTSNPGYIGSGYYHDNNSGKGNKTATYSPAIAGTYEVFTWYTAFSNRPTNVTYRVNHAGGTTDVVVNQQINNTRWVSLGRYTFDLATSDKVVITTTGTEGYFVIADAVKFDFVGCANCTTPSTTEITVDDVNATYTGSWGAGANQGYYGSGYRFCTTTGSKTATFTPNLEEEGAYELFIHYVAGSNRATNARVDIYELDGTVSSVNVNQQINGSRWNSLGTYDMGTNTKAILTNQGANNIIISDAFRWVYVGCAGTSTARRASPGTGVENNKGAAVAELEADLDEISMSTLSVYPNPFTSTLNLNVATDIAGKARVEVFDMIGKLVYAVDAQVVSGESQMELDGHTWEVNGIYVIRLHLPNGETKFAKVVKK